MQRPAVYMYRRNLPHWRMEGATYFVTWRLAAGQEVLSAAERSSVLSSIGHFDRQRYDLLAHVVMDDHVHVLVAPIGECELARIIHGWKSFTTHELQRRHGRVGRVWQSEYFDRVVRNDSELHEKANYILQNPWKRWPDLEEYEWVGVRE